jgi:hypothetical protein
MVDTLLFVTTMAVSAPHVGVRAVRTAVALRQIAGLRQPLAA